MKFVDKLVNQFDINGNDVKVIQQSNIIAFALSSRDNVRHVVKMEVANILFPDFKKIPLFPYLFGFKIKVQTKEGEVEMDIRDLDELSNCLNLRVLDHHVLQWVEKEGRLMADFYRWNKTMLDKWLPYAVPIGIASEEGKKNLDDFIQTVVEEERHFLLSWFNAGFDYRLVVTPEEHRLGIPVTKEFLEKFGNKVINNWQDAKDGQYPTCTIDIGDYIIFELNKNTLSWEVYVCEKGAFNKSYKTMSEDTLDEQLARMDLKI